MAVLKVLSLSFDEVVAQSRSTALRESGFIVMSTTQVASARVLLSREKFHVIVIGHRFSKNEKKSVATQARESGASVVLVCGASPEWEVQADVRVWAREGIGAVVGVVKKVLARQTRAAAA